MTLEELRARGELAEAVPRRPRARAHPGARLRPRSGRTSTPLGRAGPDGRRDDPTASRDARRAARGRGRDARRRCAPAPTSSSRAPSSTAAGAATRTSSSAATTARRTSASWSYDVADTKLAKRVKAAAIVQMCVYADQLERLQGIPPETISVVTGDRLAHPHRLADYAAYYRSAKAALRGAGVRRRPRRDAPPTYPEPVDHCRVCSWWIRSASTGGGPTTTSRSSRAAARTQRRALVGAGVTTLAGLAELPPRTGRSATSARGSSSGSAARPRSSAVHREDDRVPLRAHPAQPGRARQGPRRAAAALGARTSSSTSRPTHGRSTTASSTCSAGPSAVRTASPCSMRSGPTTAPGRRRCSRRSSTSCSSACARDPGMHVYHYGGYESGALKRLMQRHATREDEVDVLLRGHVLVNLYDHVVRQGIRAGVESYSIKKIETFYMPEREGGITAGRLLGRGVRALDGAEQDPAILDAIAAYNRDDCVSNLLLRDWLEARRDEAARRIPSGTDGAVPRPTSEDGAPRRRSPRTRPRPAPARTRCAPACPWTGSSATTSSRVAGCSRRSSTGIAARRSPSGGTTSGWSRRPIDDLVADGSALGGAAVRRGPGADRQVRRSTATGSTPRRTRRSSRARPARSRHRPRRRLGPSHGRRHRLDPVRHDRAQAQRRPNRHPVALIPGKPFRTEPMRAALGPPRRPRDRPRARRAGPFRAARDLLLRRPPRIAALRPDGAPLAQDGPTMTPSPARSALRLDETVLAIQGPPGTGKTHTGARMILDLVEAGKRVGVTAQSHRVIANLLEAVVEAAARGAAGSADRPALRRRRTTRRAGGIDRVATSDDVAPGLARRLVGRRRRHVLAVGARGHGRTPSTSCSSTRPASCRSRPCARVGGAAALVRPARRPEPAAAGLAGHAPRRRRGVGARAPRRRGADDRRPTAACCSGRRTASTRRSTPSSPTPSTRAGSRPHRETSLPARRGRRAGRRRRASGSSRCARRRPRTARARRPTGSRDAIGRCVGRRWIDQKGDERPLEVRRRPRRRALQRAGRRDRGAVEGADSASTPNVGTVDKFQGREAPVAIYSMTTSTPEDAPRDMEFLYSGNRLNVAVSRARASRSSSRRPELLRVACHTPEQMRLVNAFCRSRGRRRAGEPRRSCRRRGSGAGVGCR